MLQIQSRELYAIADFFGQMLQVVVRHVKGDEVDEFANTRRQLFDLVLPQAEHRQIRQVADVVADVAHAIKAQEERREGRQLVDDVGDFAELVVPQVQDCEAFQVLQSVGQARQGILAQGQGAQVRQAADLWGQSRQLVAVEVELDEVGEVAHRAGQVRDAGLAEVEPRDALVATSHKLLGHVQVRLDGLCLFRRRPRFLGLGVLDRHRFLDVGAVDGKFFVLLRLTRSLLFRHFAAAGARAQSTAFQVLGDVLLLHRVADGIVRGLLPGVGGRFVSLAWSMLAVFFHNLENCASLRSLYSGIAQTSR